MRKLTIFIILTVFVGLFASTALPKKNCKKQYSNEISKLKGLLKYKEANETYIGKLCKMRSEKEKGIFLPGPCTKAYKHIFDNIEKAMDDFKECRLYNTKKKTGACEHVTRVKNQPIDFIKKWSPDSIRQGVFEDISNKAAEVQAKIPNCK